MTDAEAPLTLPLEIMRRIGLPLLVLLVMLALVWRANWGRGPDGADRAATDVPMEPVATVPATPADREATAPAPGPEGPAFYSEATAYRIAMDEMGRCELVAVDALRGDFRRPRALKRHPGMFCCRLLDGEGRLLEETTMEAPDRVCMVLDPRAVDANGAPVPARLTAEGPVVFQVRLPKAGGAEVLEIIRLAGTGAAGGDERPLGQLVASLSLTP